MSKKRKGPAQSGQPKKRPIGPITAESVPYIVIDQNPAEVTQERQKSETDPIGKGRAQNSLETATARRGGQSTGASKGVKRPRGRPSKLLPIEQRLDLATEDFLLEVIEGRDISQSGATGKRFKAPAGLAVRTKAAELWISRRRPQLSQQAVAAQIQTDVRVETVSNRELAQSVMRVLGRADVSEVEQLAQKKLVAPTGKATGEAGTSDGPSPPCKFEYPEEPLDPKHGETVKALNGSGAFLKYYGPEHGFGGKWGCFNQANICVGRTPRWDKAVSILMNTKPSNETIQPDEFAMNEKGFEFSDRRIEHEARRQPRVIRRRGR